MSTGSAFDRVFVGQFRIPSRLGVKEREKEQPQDVIVDLHVASSHRAHLERGALSVGAAARQVSAFMQEARCQLIEESAGSVARFPVVDLSAERDWVRVSKPSAQQAVAAAGSETSRSASDLLKGEA